MSGSDNFSSTNDATRPSHHVHQSNDPLPGAKRGVNTVDYSAETMERTPSTWNERTEEQFAHEHPGMAASDDQHTKQNAFTEERPMDVQPTSAGGVAVSGNADLPQGKPSLMDKVVGKTQKVSVTLW